MRWRNCSEKLPPMETVVYLKANGVMDLGNFYEQDGCYFMYVQRNGAHDEYEKPYSAPVFGNVEWLDESESSSPLPLKDEIERLKGLIKVAWNITDNDCNCPDCWEKFKIKNNL